MDRKSDWVEYIVAPHSRWLELETKCQNQSFKVENKCIGNFGHHLVLHLQQDLDVCAKDVKPFIEKINI